jgi:hypothetical protein
MICIAALQLVNPAEPCTKPPTGHQPLLNSGKVSAPSRGAESAPPAARLGLGAEGLTQRGGYAGRRRRWQRSSRWDKSRGSDVGTQAPACTVGAQNRLCVAWPCLASLEGKPISL